MCWNKCYNFNSSNRVKEKLILVNIRELSRVPSTGESTLYIYSAWSMYTLYLAYPKCYELYIIYKVDYFVLGTLSSSLVLLNTRVVSLLNSLSFDS